MKVAGFRLHSPPAPAPDTASRPPQMKVTPLAFATRSPQEAAQHHDTHLAPNFCPSSASHDGPCSGLDLVAE